MHAPDASLHDPRPECIRALIERSGLSQSECARRIGIDPSTLRRHITRAASHQPADYRTQYALEALAELSIIATPCTTECGLQAAKTAK